MPCPVLFDGDTGYGTFGHFQMLVKRLQRVRDSRAATRAERARRMGDDLRRNDRLD